MSLVTYELATPSSSYFDFAQAVAIRRMALNLSDQPAYLLESETTLQLENIPDLCKCMLFDFLWNTVHASMKP